MTVVGLLSLITAVTHRVLGNGDYMEDENGNRYLTYSVSWRYLGMYLDCDLENTGSSNPRRLKEKDNQNNACPRKVMWAAVSRTCMMNNELTIFLAGGVGPSTTIRNMKGIPLENTSFMIGKLTPGIIPRAKRTDVLPWTATYPIHATS
jgi:hypothetical protein